MSIFTNQRSNLIIAFLILLNCITIGFYWFSIGPGGMRHRNPKGAMGFLIKELKLSDQQIAAFKTLQNQHRQRTTNTLNALHENRKSIISALTEATPDTSTAFALVREVGNAEMDMQLFLIEHFMNLHQVCDPDQKEILRTIFKETIVPPRPIGPKGKKRGPR